jgi:hypothetical protein
MHSSGGQGKQSANNAVSPPLGSFDERDLGRSDSAQVAGRSNLILRESICHSLQPSIAQNIGFHYASTVAYPLP